MKISSSVYTDNIKTTFEQVVLYLLEVSSFYQYGALKEEVEQLLGINL
jgi:hypothetical protein